MSNASQVVIRNVGFGLSGNFSCEVTADAPSFSTRAAQTHLQVVGKFLCRYINLYYVKSVIFALHFRVFW